MLSAQIIGEVPALKSAPRRSAVEYEEIALILLFLILLILFFVLMQFFWRKLVKLRNHIADLNDEHRDLAGFLGRFASGMRSEDGLAGAMHNTAAEIANKIHATSVCIYECSGNELFCQGVYGPYLLVHSRNEKIFQDHQALYEALRRERISAGSGFLGKIMVERKPVLIADASLEDEFSEYPQCLKLESLMAVPLLKDGELAGVAVALNNALQQWQTFSKAQFERFTYLTERIVMVQQLTRVFREISKQERIDQELGFARSLQQALLPPMFPKWEDFTITARTSSAKEVNGDFYDFIRIDDNRVLVLLGDACGKGIPACLLALMTRSFARSLADNFTTLTAFIEDLNGVLFRDTEPDRFITLGCCLLDRRNWLIEFGRAGHTDLLTFIHKHLRVLSPDGAALGIMPKEVASFETICISMDVGTHAIMFSDGLTEACNEQGEEFGMERLSKAFFDGCSASNVPENILSSIIGAVSSFEKEQTDDRTIVLISRGADEA